MKRSLKMRAYEEAAAILETEMDAVDLPTDLTEEEEGEMREFIRNDIVKKIRELGKKR